jgi:phage gp16-like protein
MSKINRKKISLIHVAKAKLGLDDEEYRETLLNLCNVDSAKDLTELGFNRLMRFFEAVGFQSSNYKMPNITKSQEWRLRELEKALGWKSNPRRLQGFCVKINKRELEQLNKAEAGFLIGALERTLKFKLKKQAKDN